MKVQAMIGRYQLKLVDAKTKDEILDVLLSMDDGYTQEALEIVRQMDDDDLKEWRQGLAMERLGEENADEWYEKYIDLLIPPPFAGLIMVAQGEVG